MTRRRTIMLALILLLAISAVCAVISLWDSGPVENTYEDQPKGGDNITQNDPKTKGTPIDKLNNNYEIFERVATYIDETYIEFYLANTPTELLFYEAGIPASDVVELDIESIEISDELKYMMYDLKIFTIHEWDDYITFSFESTSYERGVAYSRTGKSLKIGGPPPTEFIRDNWYYYEAWGV